MTKRIFTADELSRHIDTLETQDNHASVTVDAEKTITVEGGGTINEKVSWTAYAKKVYKGPWLAGSTWKW